MSKIFSAEELHSIVGGKLFKNDWLVSGISIDSRTIKKNDIFIALKAKRDGNDFIVSAIENGAKAAIINKIPKDLPKNFPFILVNNSVEALYSIAKYSRKKYEGRVIAITGSVGKTSTKDILTKMLSTFGVTHSSQKSFNNHLGVPLTLANIPKNADYVICEIGMNSKGEIEPLSKLVAPDVAVITNISAAHLASFKNLREIAYEKASICFGLKKNGLLILKNKSYGSLLIKNKVFTNFSIGALGSHQLKNCLAALAVILSYDLSLEKALKELKDWVPRDGRGNFLDVNLKYKLKNIRIRVIDESYNSNPTSLNASLEILKSVQFDAKKSSRKIAILGDMLELGVKEKEFHRDIANNSNIFSFDTIHCVGSLMKELYLELPQEKKGLLVSNPSDLLSHILINAEDKDIYLLKGSNSIGLSFIANKLYKLNNTYV